MSLLKLNSSLRRPWYIVWQIFKPIFVHFYCTLHHIHPTYTCIITVWISENNYILLSEIHLLLSCFRIIDLHQTFLLDYITILSRVHSVIYRRAPPAPYIRARLHAVPRRQASSPQGKARPLAMRKFTSRVFPAP